jgi:hypothetical protein
MEALREALGRGGIATAMPEPSWTGYLQALAEGVARWFAGWLEPTARALGAQTELAAVVAWVLVGSAGVLLVLGLARLAAGAGRGWRLRPDGPRARVERTPSPPTAKDRLAWRREVEARLAEGRIRDALEAVWWWMALSLAPERAHRSWTSRDLLRDAGRDDLAPLAEALDALAYAPRRPRADEVRRLLDSWEAAVP